MLKHQFIKQLPHPSHPRQEKKRQQNNSQDSYIAKIQIKHLELHWPLTLNAGFAFVVLYVSTVILFFKHLYIVLESRKNYSHLNIYIHVLMPLPWLVPNSPSDCVIFRLIV